MSDGSTIDHEAAVAIAQALSELNANGQDATAAFDHAVAKLDCIQAPKLFVDAANFISAKARAYGVPDPLRASVNEPLLTRKAAALAALWWENHTADWNAAPPVTGLPSRP